MNIYAGISLSSLASLDDTYFGGADIFIAECNGKGAIGFVINKPFSRRLNELEEFRNGPAFPLYEGGPVDQEHLFFIHCCPAIIEGGVLISDSIYLGGNFKQAVAGINNRIITTNDIKIFIGYCGWDGEELKEETEEGSWLIVKKNKEDIFM